MEKENLEPHQQRVVDEYDELSDRRERLNSFFSTDIFSKLHDDEKDRMLRQYKLMSEYAGVLLERMEGWE